MLELGLADVVGMIELPGFALRELAFEIVDLIEEVAVAQVRIHVDDKRHWRPTRDFGVTFIAAPSHRATGVCRRSSPGGGSICRSTGCGDQIEIDQRQSDEHERHARNAGVSLDCEERAIDGKEDDRETISKKTDCSLCGR